MEASFDCVVLASTDDLIWGSSVGASSLLIPSFLPRLLVGFD